MASPHHHLLVLVFGLLGNVVSFCLFLAPLPTFCRILEKKSTEGFQSIPYSVALFSAMLTLYYASLKEDALMLITINSIGCAIEGIYLIIYIIYATKTSRIHTLKLVVLLNMVAYLLIILSTSLFTHGELRVHVVGWTCATFSVCVFAAPLSIMRHVIKTKSVEYMPFTLSFCLTLCATCWLGYGLAVEDYYIASPNVLGFLFGMAQMILYLIYMKPKNEILPETNLAAVNDPQVGKDCTCNGSLNQPEEANKAMEPSELIV